MMVCERCFVAIALVKFYLSVPELDSLKVPYEMRLIAEVFNRGLLVIRRQRRMVLRILSWMPLAQHFRIVCLLYTQLHCSVRSRSFWDELHGISDSCLRLLVLLSASAISV